MEFLPDCLVISKCQVYNKWRIGMRPCMFQGVPWEYNRPVATIPSTEVI